MKKIKISFVGVGFMSQIAHLVNYYNNKSVELYEVCDLDYELAKNVKKKFNFTGQIHTDYKQMDTKNVDGIVIVVQRRLLTSIVKFFLNKKCNVFSEKPHSYSIKDYKKNQKIQKKIWLKGYVRRHDLVVKYLKNNLISFKKDLGDIISVKYFASSGNSYLGSKHFVRPYIKKEIKSELSKIPKFIPSKFKNLYDVYANTSLHFIDLFDFLNIKLKNILFTKIDKNNFLCNFNASHSTQKNKFFLQIFLNSSPNKSWDEKLTFLYEGGQAIITFNSPLFKKTSHSLKIYNKKNDKIKNIVFKKKWGFEQQTIDYINMIKDNRLFNKHFNDGINSISNYEKIWKFFLKR